MTNTSEKNKYMFDRIDIIGAINVGQIAHIHTVGFDGKLYDLRTSRVKNVMLAENGAVAIETAHSVYMGQNCRQVIEATAWQNARENS